jgi:hypothetical protein
MSKLKGLELLSCTMAEIDLTRHYVCLLYVVPIAPDQLDLVHVFVADHVSEFQQLGKVLIVPFVEVILNPRFKPVQERVKTDLVLKGQQVGNIGERPLFRVQFSAAVLQFAELV